jgi:hypothetical protein
MIRLEDIKEYNALAVILEGYDKAIVGYDMVNHVIIYDRDKMIKIATEEIIRDTEENNPQVIAEEYLNYNVFSAHFGDFTPIFLEKVSHD